MRNKRDLIEQFIDEVNNDGRVEEQWRRSVLPINPFHGAFFKGASLDVLTTATTHVQELKDRGANQVELLALQLENGELGSVAVTVPATASSPRTWS